MLDEVARKGAVSRYRTLSAARGNGYGMPRRRTLQFLTNSWARRWFWADWQVLKLDPRTRRSSLHCFADWGQWMAERWAIFCCLSAGGPYRL